MNTYIFGIAIASTFLWAFVCHKIADRKGLSEIWILIGFFFGIFAVIGILLVPDRSGSREAFVPHIERKPTRDEKRCLFCGNIIDRSAIKCSGCGADLVG